MKNSSFTKAYELLGPSLPIYKIKFPDMFMYQVAFYLQKSDFFQVSTKLCTEKELPEFPLCTNPTNKTKQKQTNKQKWWDKMYMLHTLPKLL